MQTDIIATAEYRIDVSQRPNLYLQRVVPHLKKIRELVLAGETDYSICEQLAVSPRTWVDWKKKYPELAECYNFANHILVKKVENALLKKATGFSVVENWLEML